MKYKFQFKTGNICDGSMELKVENFIGEVKAEEMNPSLASTIEAHGGQLVPDKPPAKKSGAKKGKANPVKWSNEGGEK